MVSAGASANPLFGSVGDADQRSKIVTFDVAPSYTRTLSNAAVFNLGGFVRRDGYNYYPSDNPLADKSATNLQNQSISQDRTLLNAGLHTDVAYVKGIHNVKIGAQYTQTFLDEHDTLGVANNTFNSPCVDANGAAQPGYAAPNQCLDAGLFANPDYLSQLAPYELTRGGGQFTFAGHTDVKELALYLQDQIKVGAWMFNVGMREDLYNGLTVARQAEPRAGIAYTLKKTGTVLRASYARTLESPFNENLVLSSVGCGDNVLSPCLPARRVSRPSSILASRTSSTRACSRPLAATSSSAASTSGSTRTTPSTSAYSATRRSRSPSTGITRRSREWPPARSLPTTRASLPST